MTFTFWEKTRRWRKRRLEETRRYIVDTLELVQLIEVRELRGSRFSTSTLLSFVILYDSQILHRHYIFYSYTIVFTHSILITSSLSLLFFIIWLGDYSTYVNSNIILGWNERVKGVLYGEEERSFSKQCKYPITIICNRKGIIRDSFLIVFFNHVYKIELNNSFLHNRQKK